MIRFKRSRNSRIQAEKVVSLRVIQSKTLKRESAFQVRVKVVL